MIDHDCCKKDANSLKLMAAALESSCSFLLTLAATNRQRSSAELTTMHQVEYSNEQVLLYTLLLLLYTGTNFSEFVINAKLSTQKI